MSSQKQRKLGWKENRETELAKVQSKTPVPSTSRSGDNQEDLVASLRQQLTAKTEEYLTCRLDAIEAVNAKILRNQLQMQEDFVKVMFLQVVVVVVVFFQKNSLRRLSVGKKR